MGEILARLEVLGVRGTRWFALFGLVCLVGLAMMTIVDVLMRWLLNSPIDGVADVGRLIVAIVIAAFFPAALAQHHHISITFLGSALGPRVAAWLEVLAALVTTIFFFILGWQFILYTAELMTSGETTWLMGWAVAPWWSVTTFFLLLCIPVQIIIFLVQIRRAFAARHQGSGGAGPSAAGLES